VNAQGLDSITPLHDACVNGHVQIVKLLLSHGARTDVSNSRGEYPRDVCRSAQILKLIYSLSRDPLPGLMSRRGSPSTKMVSTKEEKMEEGFQDHRPLTPPQQGPIFSGDNNPASPRNPVRSPDKSSKVDKNAMEFQSKEDDDPYEFNECSSTKIRTKEECSSAVGSVEKGAEEMNNSDCSEHEDLNKKKKKKEDPSTPLKGGARPSRPASEELLPLEERRDSPTCDGPKVPPLKIVLSNSTTPPLSQDTSDTTNNGSFHCKGGQQSRCLPYVVNSEETQGEGEGAGHNIKQEGPMSPGTRVTRSQRGSANEDSSAAPVVKLEKIEKAEEIEKVEPPTPAPQYHDSLHPRKRKIIKEEVADHEEVNSQPEQQQLSNCTEMFLKIRKQIDERRKLLMPVQPKPPQGFKDYLMNRCTYALAGKPNSYRNTNTPQPSPPSLTHPGLVELFNKQEKQRGNLKLGHRVEREKLVLSVEQEILRVHGRAARAVANQAQPFSACTYLRDQEVYNVITAEQEEKHRNDRSRYNGRLFRSWLQDVDDKWEKIKESMVLRQQNEAESLNAVHKMNWEWKMMELGQCSRGSKPPILPAHVPTVVVSDFDLLPS